MKILIHIILLLAFFPLAGCGKKSDDSSNVKDLHDFSNRTLKHYYYWIEDRKVNRTTCLEDRTVWTRATCPLFRKQQDAKAVFDELLKPYQAELERTLLRKSDVEQRYNQVVNKLDEILNAEDNSAVAAEVIELQHQRDEILERLVPVESDIRGLENEIQTLKDEYQTSGDVELLRQLAAREEKLAKTKTKAQGIRDELQVVLNDLFNKSSQLMDDDIFKQLVRERSNLVDDLESVEESLKAVESSFLGVHRVYKMLADNSFAYRIRPLDDLQNAQLLYDREAFEALENLMIEVDLHDDFGDFDLDQRVADCSGSSCVFTSPEEHVFFGGSSNFPRSASHRGAFTCKVLDLPSFHCSSVQLSNRDDRVRFSFKKAIQLDSNHSFQIGCDDWSNGSCPAKLQREGVAITYFQDNTQTSIDLNDPVFMQDGLYGSWSFSLTCDQQENFKISLECSMEAH